MEFDEDEAENTDYDEYYDVYEYYGSDWTKLESRHPGDGGEWAYIGNQDWKYTAITFSKDTIMAGDEYDGNYLEIYDFDQDEKEFDCYYYGDSLAGKTITVPGSSFFISYSSSYSSDGYGFKVTNVTEGKAEDVSFGTVNVTDTSQFQSRHPVLAGTDKSWIYTAPNNQKYTAVTFSQDTELDGLYDEYNGNYDGDYITIYADYNSQKGEYNYQHDFSGKELAGKTITVPGNSVEVRLQARGDKSKGFTVTDVCPGKVEDVKYGKVTVTDLSELKSKNPVDAGTEVELNYSASPKWKATEITFSDDTELATNDKVRDNDYISIRVDGNDDYYFWELYEGIGLKGQTITVPGNQFSIYLKTYGSESKGFRVENVKEGKLENVKNGTQIVKDISAFQSKHPADKDTQKIWRYKANDNRKATEITFSKDTVLKAGDYITISDGFWEEGFESGYTKIFRGNELKNKTITVSGNNVEVGLVTKSANSYVFKITQVKAGNPEKITIGRRYILDKYVSVSSKVAFNGKACVPKVVVKDGNKVLKNHSDYTVQYKNNSKIGKATVIVSGVTDCSGTDYIGTVTKTFSIIPAAPGSLKSTSVSAKSIGLSWKKVNGASGYLVYQKNGKNWKKIKTISSGKTVSCSVSGLKAGANYQFAVKAYSKISSGTVYGYLSKTLSVTSLPVKLNAKVTSGKNKVTLKWSKVTGATAYKVYYKSSKNGKWKQYGKNTTKTSYTITNLRRGKTYYFKVAVSGKTGNKKYFIDGNQTYAKVK